MSISSNRPHCPAGRRLLLAGLTAGGGVQSMLLGTVKDASGNVLNTAGNPVTSGQTQPGTSSSSTGGSGGY